MSTNRFADMLRERLRTPGLSKLELRSREAEPHICLRCDRKFGLRSPSYRRPDGARVAWADAVVGGLLPAWTLSQVGATFAECPRCGKGWPLFFPLLLCQGEAAAGRVALERLEAWIASLPRAPGCGTLRR
jgi:hypothetical protein